MIYAGETHDEPSYMYLLSGCLKMESRPFYGTGHITSIHNLCGMQKNAKQHIMEQQHPFTNYHIVTSLWTFRLFPRNPGDSFSRNTLGTHRGK